MKGLAKEHVGISQGHRRQCGEGRGEEGLWALSGGRQSGGKVATCHSVNNKNSFKKEFFLKKRRAGVWKGLFFLSCKFTRIVLPTIQAA